MSDATLITLGDNEDKIVFRADEVQAVLYSRSGGKMVVAFRGGTRWSATEVTLKERNETLTKIWPHWARGA